MKQFDPEGLLFTTGVHCPQLVFVGDKTRRTPEAIERRNEKRKGRGKARDDDQAGKGTIAQKGKKGKWDATGNIAQKGPNKGKEKGKSEGKGSGRWVWLELEHSQQGPWPGGPFLRGRGYFDA